jgi:hypothetical protein
MKKMVSNHAMPEVGRRLRGTTRIATTRMAKSIRRAIRTTIVVRLMPASGG